MSEGPDEILISTEDLEFLQEQIRILGSENKFLKESQSAIKNYDPLVNQIYSKCIKDGKHSTNEDKLMFIDSYIMSLQRERETFGSKLEAILSQKESDALSDKLQMDHIRKELEDELNSVYTVKNSIEITLNILKERLIDQLQHQMSYFTTNDPRASGSTGESSKPGSQKLPSMKSDPEEFTTLFDKLWRDREESLSDNQTKVSLEEIKNWEDKINKLKGT